MKNTFFLFFISLSITSFSQTVYTRPYSRNPIKWDSEKEKYIKDSSNGNFITPNPKIILYYDEIKIIDGDTSVIYLNETPEKSEDSVSIDLKWFDSKDFNGRECYVFLFFYTKDNDYGLRILFTDDNTGIEYYMKPLKVDVIPYKKD
jgi:hypothetical protein